jgi:hypothetical protein
LIDLRQFLISDADADNFAQVVNCPERRQLACKRDEYPRYTAPSSGLRFTLLSAAELRLQTSDGVINYGREVRNRARSESRTLR